MIINSNTKLFRYLKAYNKAKTGIKKVEPKGYTIIKRKTFKKLEFMNFSWAGQYKNCRFIDCSFEKIFGFFLDLKNCKFINCRFENSRFSHFENIITDGSWNNLQFENCLFRNVQ